MLLLLVLLRTLVTSSASPDDFVAFNYKVFFAHQGTYNVFGAHLICPRVTFVLAKPCSGLKPEHLRLQCGTAK
jgi:hypothetical protein